MISEVFTEEQAERNKTIQMGRERMCASENEITKLCKSSSCASIIIIMHLKNELTESKKQLRRGRSGKQGADIREQNIHPST